MCPRSDPQPYPPSGSSPRIDVPYQSLVEQSPVITYIAALDEASTTLYVSPQVEQLLGYTRAEFLDGDSWLRAVHPEDRDRVLAAVTSGRADATGFSIEYRMLTATGETRCFLDEARPAYDEEGRPLHIHGVMMDITERKRAERDLRESEERFRLLAEHATDIIFRIEIDPVPHFIYLSPAVTMRLGYLPQQFYDDFSLFEKIVHPEDLGWLYPALAKDDDSPITFRCLHADGHIVWFEQRRASIADKAGRVFAYEGIMRDVSARTRAESLLAETNRTLRALIDFSPLAIVQMDLDLNVTVWNPTAERWFGWSEQEVLGGPLPFVLDVDRQFVRESMLGVLSGAEMMNHEARRATKTGAVIDVEISAACVRGPAGEPVGVVAMYSDNSARKTAERDLRRSEELYRTLVESLEDSVNLRDVDGRYLLANSECAARLGMPREELLGKTARDVHSEEVALRSMADDATVLATGRTLDVVKDFPDRERATRCHVRKTPLRSSSGRIVGVVTISRDITQQERAAKAVRDSEERFKSIFDNSAVGVVLTDPNGVVIAANTAMERFLGYAPDALLGKDGFMLAAGYPDVADRLRKGIANGSLHEISFDGPFARLDGDQGWGRVVVSVKRDDDDGTVEFLVVVVEDMTARHQVEVALREATGTLEATINSSPVAILSVDQKMAVKVWNPAAEALFGWTAEELVGRALPQVQPDAMDEATLWHELVRSGRQASNVELKRKRKDGSLVDVSLSIAPVFDGSGAMAGAVGMYTDITERKRADAVLTRSLSALREAMEGTIHAMAEMTELRDPYTAGHQRRVSEIAVAIANEMGLPGEELECVRLAGLVHDIGKIGIPSEILTRPGKLGGIELSLAKLHPQAGYDMLKGIRFPWPIAEVVLQHHERLDGSGYPQGLTGDKIVLAAKILAVADVVEAMSSHRPYRPALGFPAALQEIQSSRGTRYDARVVDACDAIPLSDMVNQPWEG